MNNYPDALNRHLGKTMTQQPQEGRTLNQQNQPEGAKKAYFSPSLLEYGTLANLTQGGGFTGGTDSLRRRRTQ